MFTNRPNIHISKTQIKLKKKKKDVQFLLDFFFLLLRATAGILFRVGGWVSVCSKKEETKDPQISVLFQSNDEILKQKTNSLLHPVPTPYSNQYFVFFVRNPNSQREKERERKKKSNLFLQFLFLRENILRKDSMFLSTRMVQHVVKESFVAIYTFIL